MTYFTQILKCTLTIAFFIFVAVSVSPGFEEVVVGGLSLIYFSLTLELALVRGQIKNTHLGLSRIILAMTSNIKEDYLKENVGRYMEDLVPIEEEFEKIKTKLGIESIFGTILIVLSVGLIIKGLML